jgi:adenosylcobyric acid synthase
MIAHTIRSTYRPLMVMGCSSSAGKSLLATALCAWFRRHGVDAAPYKAQNMSNNARVVAGGEIGVAQWLQARAAGVVPDVRMNPVLVKPEADTRSQVVVRGVVDRAVSALPWEERHDHLWAAMADSFASLQADHELVVIEGAGSPAETNLRDQVNNRVCEHVDAATLLVSDIDRGGSFAHLLGTWSLVPDATRDRLFGFVLNKFRGDASLLHPAPADLTARTGMAHLGTVPMLTHHVPAEEGASAFGSVDGRGPSGGPTVAILRFPYGSNLDEFRLVGDVARLVWAERAADLDGADWVVLPGSKHVAADLRWLRERGFDDAIVRAATRGAHVLGVCGGAMMLGQRIDDPGAVEADREAASVDGLDLLPLVTLMEPDKLVHEITVMIDGITVTGYEIRHGRVTAGRAVESVAGVLWRRGRVTATTVHGLLEHPALVERWFGVDTVVDPLDESFAVLADAVEAHLDTSALWAALRAGP